MAAIDAQALLIFFVANHRFVTEILDFPLMPELPEVETMVRGIRPFVEGRAIALFRKCACRCKPLTVQPPVPQAARRVVGQTIAAVFRRAKRIIMRLESGDAFVIEPRMTGLMLLSDPPTVEHLRLEWRLTVPSNASAGPRSSLRPAQGAETSLWFWDRRGLGTCRLYTAEELTECISGGRLGPDALEMTAGDWADRCRRTNRPIKVALLDQKLAAGIGNLYASEILHLARIDPRAPADRLTAARVRRLHDAVQTVLRDAIEHEGSTLGDGTYRNALNLAGSYQNQHRVYARHDERCLSCGQGTVQRIVQAQRSTFYCPRCQR